MGRADHTQVNHAIALFVCFPSSAHHIGNTSHFHTTSHNHKRSPKKTSAQLWGQEEEEEEGFLGAGFFF